MLIREAKSDDSIEIVRLIQPLSTNLDEASPITGSFVC